MGWLFDRMFGWLGGWLPAAHADSAALHAVGVDLTPRAEGLPEVRMLAEEVNIYLFANLAVVEATFELANEGPEAEIEVGFPQFRAQSEFKARDAMPLGFHVEVDGRAVTHDVRRLDNMFYPMWYAWTQRFAAGQRSTVAVRYWVPLISYNLLSRMPFTYVLRTGRFWKGTIGHAVVRVHASDIPLRAIQEATPPGYRIDRAARTLTWEFRDLMPEDDIGLLISPAIIQAAMAGMAADDILDLNERRPPPGTRVLVGGRLVFPGKPWFDQSGTVDRPIKAILRGERYHDGNTVIPDRIKDFRYEAPERDLTIIPALLRPQTHYRQQMIPYIDFGSWIKEFIAGTVQYHNDMLLIKADERITLGDDEKEPYTSDQLQSRFPWVDRARLTSEVWNESRGIPRKVQEGSGDEPDWLHREDHDRADPERRTRWPGGATRYREGEIFYGTQFEERAKVDHG